MEYYENNSGGNSAPMQTPMGTPMQTPMGAPMQALMGAPMQTPMGAPMQTPMGAPMQTSTSTPSQELDINENPHENKWSKRIITLIIIGLLSTGGYFGYTKFFKKINIEKNTTTIEKPENTTNQKSEENIKNNENSKEDIKSEENTNIEIQSLDIDLTTTPIHSTNKSVIVYKENSEETSLEIAIKLADNSSIELKALELCKNETGTSCAQIRTILNSDIKDLINIDAKDFYKAIEELEIKNHENIFLRLKYLHEDTIAYSNMMKFRAEKASESTPKRTTVKRKKIKTENDELTESLKTIESNSTTNSTQETNSEKTNQTMSTDQASTDQASTDQTTKKNLVKEKETSNTKTIEKDSSQKKTSPKKEKAQTTPLKINPEIEIIPVKQEIFNKSDVTVYRFKIKNDETATLKQLNFNVSGKINNKFIGQDYNGNDTDNPSTLNGFEKGNGISTWNKESTPTLHFSEAYLWDRSENKKVESVIYYGNSDKQNETIIVVQGNIEVSKEEKEYELKGKISGLKSKSDSLSFSLANNAKTDKKNSLEKGKPPKIGANSIWEKNDKEFTYNFSEKTPNLSQKFHLNQKSKPPELIVNTSTNSPKGGLILAAEKNKTLGEFTLQNLTNKDITIERISVGLVLQPEYQYNDYLKNIGLYTKNDLLNPISTASTYNNKVRFKDFDLNAIPGTTTIIIKADIPKIEGYIESNTIIAPFIQNVEAHQNKRKIEIQIATPITCDSLLELNNSISSSAVTENDCSEIQEGDILSIEEEYLAVSNKFTNEEGKITYKFIRGLSNTPVTNSKEINTLSFNKLNAVGNILILKQTKPLIQTIKSNTELKSDETLTIYKFRINTQANKDLNKKDQITHLAQIVFSLEGIIGGREISDQLKNFTLLADGKKQKIDTRLIQHKNGTMYLVANFKKSKTINEQGNIFELQAYMNSKLENGDHIKIYIPSIMNKTSKSKFAVTKLEDLITKENLSELLTGLIWTDISSNTTFLEKQKQTNWTHDYFLETLPTEIQNLSFIKKLDSKKDKPNTDEEKTEDETTE